MSDISDNNSALTTKIVGANSTGVEQTPIQSTDNGAIHSNLRDSSGLELATSSNPFITNNVLSKNAELSKCFVATTNNILKGTAESPFILLSNPNGSGKTVFVHEISFSGAGTFRIYLLPTVTANGTSIPPYNKRITSGTQGNVALLFHTPTVSANGNLAYVYIPTAQTGTQIIPLTAEIILPPNTAILITTAMAANNTVTNTFIQWSEI